MSLDDAAARRRALAPDASFIVEAAAGSGKTSLLTQRILVLLARVDEPENVLAVTFTRKAVEEMRGRVLKALASVDGPPPASPHDQLTRELAGAVLARDAALGWRLREHPARLRIQTLDALAAGLARRLPLTAGLAAQLEVIDDASDLHRLAARDTLALLFEDGVYAELVAQVLEHLDNDARKLEALLIDMLARRDLWLTRVVQGADRAAAEAALAAAVMAEVDTLREALLAALPAAQLPALAELARLAATGVAQSGRDTPLHALAGFDGMRFDAGICAGLAELLLTGSGSVRVKLDKNLGVQPQTSERFKALFAPVADALREAPAVCARLHRARDLPPPTYTTAQWRTIEAMYGLLKLAVAQLDLTFAHAGRCDFTAITHAAQQALGAADAPSDLSLALDYRLEHLLVDEFQDTSQTQHELLEALTAGWTGDDARTLFFVGDPLQSIYRFRQAEVRLFVQTTQRRRWGSVPLETLRLTANFRTSEPVIEWINGALERAFVGAPDSLPDYVALSATREAPQAPAVSVHALDAEDGTAEALALLGVVEAARARRPQAGIAVLVRGRSHLGLLPALLAAARVPVAATDIEPLAALPVVNDLLVLTRALAQPADRVAWLALLRAPWCGLSLASLAALIKGRRDALVWEALQEPHWRASLDDDERARVDALCAVLASALPQAHRVAWTLLVERAWLQLNGPVLVTDAAELRHVQRYFELLTRFEAAGNPLRAEALADFLARHYAPVPREDGQAVAIMTVHRAKGLEFDIVVVPGLDRQPRSELKQLALWHEHPVANALLLAPLSPPGADKEPIYAYLRRLEAEEQAAEGYRLLYVALTRARDELHLCVRRKRKADGELAKGGAGSFLGMLWQTLAEPLTVLPAAPRATVQLPPQPTRRRLSRASLPLAPTGVNEPDAASMDAAPEFEWASPTAKHVGTVTHLLLELVGAQGLSGWGPETLPARLDFIRHELAARGVPRRELETAAARVRLALENTLASARGRWIFDPAHGDSASERHYTAVFDGVLSEAVLDRSFIDTDGVRWIIDFKTGEHLGGSVEVFMDSEVERYRPQLERYARMLGELEDCPIALGLYFPLLDGWREWRYGAR
jgi:ATP-dependent helicase/nuclease subunit A